jgi:glycosyltransferase involved in cell wall biosynthesis
MNSFWSACDIGVAPNTTLVESFGLAAAEASAAGIPVVASRIGGVPEVVEDGVTGTLTQPGDTAALSEAIAAYSKDAGLRGMHGEAGRARVEAMFSIERNVTDYLDLISSLDGPTEAGA